MCLSVRPQVPHSMATDSSHVCSCKIGQAGGVASVGLGLALRQAAQGPCEGSVNAPPHLGHTSTTPSPVAIA